MIFKKYILALTLFSFLNIFSQTNNRDNEFIVGFSERDKFKSGYSDSKKLINELFDITNNTNFDKVDIITFFQALESFKIDYSLYLIDNDSILSSLLFFEKINSVFVQKDTNRYRLKISKDEIINKISSLKQIDYYSESFLQVEKAKNSKNKYDNSKLLFFSVSSNEQYKFEGSFRIEVPKPLFIVSKNSEDFVYTSEKFIVDKYTQLIKSKYPSYKFQLRTVGGGSDVIFLEIISSEDFFFEFDLYPIYKSFEPYYYYTQSFVKK